MDNSKWKLGVKIVAYFDLITSMIASYFIVGAAMFFLLMNYLDHFTVSRATNVSNPVNACVLMCLLSIIVCIAFWASTQLLRAVEEGIDKTAALITAKIWRNVNIVIIVHAIIGLVGFPSVISGLALALRGIFVFIVWKFIATLRSETTASLQTEVDHTASNGKVMDSPCCEDSEFAV